MRLSRLPGFHLHLARARRLEKRGVAVPHLHQFSPELPIFVRARDMLHGRRLEMAGATQAVPETTEASLQLGAIAMTSMGVSSDDVMGIMQELRNDNYAHLGDAVDG